MPRMREKAQVKQNLELWLNNLFLTDGFYSDVSVGETDIYARDISRLEAVSDPSYPDNIVWQSAFKNWVHESGISPSWGLTPPIIASGVTVNSVFYAHDTGSPSYNSSFAHAIDYPNGRIIFESPVAASSVVQAAFSFKEIAVEQAQMFANENKEFYFETTYKDHPSQTGVITYPKENSRTLPMVAIDIAGRSAEGYELGNASNLIELRGAFIIWAHDSYMLDQIEDIICNQEHVVLIGIDFNTAPDPLTYQGDKNSLFTSYSDMASLDGSHLWRRIYIDELDSRRVEPFFNIERTQVNFLIRVYPNF